MRKIGENIKRLIMSLSFKKRKKKSLEHYRQEIKRCQNMKEDELNLEYIDMKTEYEHRKNIMFIFMVFVLLSILMDMWKYFYVFIEKVISYNALHKANEVELIQMAVTIFVIFIVFISSIIIGILFSYTRRINKIYRRLLIIDKFR